MVTSFPVPYPDELLYSLIARYHVRSGNTSPKASIEDLFSSRTAAATVDIPCNINELCCNLPDISKIEPVKLIMVYTLFPFYTAFLQQKRVDSVMSDMKSNNGGDIHTRIGIMASKISVPEFLRFCPQCILYDKKVYGEYYWHRIHQIPGVLVCPEHNKFLLDSSIPVHGMNKHEFFIANEYNCILKPSIISSSDFQNKLSILAKDIVWLMRNYELIRHSRGLKDGFRDQYITTLKEVGLATACGRVHQEEFIEAFKTFYGDIFLSSIHCLIEDFDGNWLSSIVRKHRKAFHPLKHLLLIRFLTGNLEDFFELGHRYTPFGKGPWPCMNAASNHYRRLVIKNLKVNYSTDMKKPMGTFICTCGFIYKRTGPDESEKDIYKIGRVIQFGPLWEGKLKELVEKDKLGLREISRKLNVDTNTVKRYAGLLNLQTNWETNKANAFKNLENSSLKPLNHESNECIRDRWLELKYKHPEASKTQLRDMDKSAYNWLYRNDRDWLKHNSPVRRKVASKKTRVDWCERDREILKEVKQVVNHILYSDSKPERITIGRVGRRIGQLALLEKHLSKMPKTKKYLKKVVETVEQFEIRRIKWCAKEMHKNGEEIKKWRLIRMAGLGQGYSEKVERVLNNEVNDDVMHIKDFDSIV